MHYQPLIDLKSNTTCSFEALLRWTHPQRGTVPPSVFIPAAEEIGVIQAIGEWVLRRARMLCSPSMLTVSAHDARFTSYAARSARWAQALRVCALLLSAAFVPGCADSYVGARALGVQGKFDHNTCEQLAASHRSLSAAIEASERLQKKAESATAGFLLGGMAYGPPLAQARADRRIVEDTQAEKKCEEKPKP